MPNQEIFAMYVNIFIFANISMDYIQNIQSKYKLPHRKMSRTFLLIVKMSKNCLFEG